MQEEIDEHNIVFDIAKLTIIRQKKEQQNLALFLDKYKTQLKELVEEKKILKSSNYSSVLLLREKRRLSQLIKSSITEFNARDFEIKTGEIYQLKLEKNIQGKLDKITPIKSRKPKNQNDNSFSNDYNSEITTKGLFLPKLLTIIVGFVAGFFLSIFVVIIRQAFLQEQK